MAEQERIPIFPLSNVVLFPHIQTPLHLFEPRYRQMAAESIAGSRRIGMVVVRPERVDEMSGDPPVYPIGCAGDIPEYRELPDGRFNIVLVGTNRFRILEEVGRPSGQLYRVARVEILEDAYHDDDAPRVQPLRSQVVDLAARLVQSTGDAEAAEFSSEYFRDVDDVSLVNALSNAFAFSPREKQGLLEANTIPERFERLCAVMSFRLAESNPSRVPDSGVLH